MSEAILTIIYYCIAVLKLSRKVPEILIKGRTIHTSMSNNTVYVGSAATLVLLDAALVELDENEVGMRTKPPVKTVAERNATLVTVKSILKTLRLDVQKLADADPVNAEIIITGASMEVKIVTRRQKQKNDVKNTGNAGEVIVFAEGSGPHEWEKSSDNITFTPLHSTMVAQIVVEGLTVGQKLYFRNRKMLHNGEYGNWSQSVYIIVT